jgi:hypothetical protein
MMDYLIASLEKSPLPTHLQQDQIDDEVAGPRTSPTSKFRRLVHTDLVSDKNVQSSPRLAHVPKS